MRQYFSKQNRALLSELVRTDFKLRYQGSVLGYAWSLLRPLLLFIILYLVFVKVIRVDGGIPHYKVYLLLGIVIWNFFTEMTVQGLGSIVGRGDLLRKVPIPRWLILFSISISALINLALNLVVVAVFMFFDHVSIMSSLVLLPLILAEVYILALGVSLFLSAAYVQFRDLSYIWEVILQAGFYITPVLYAMSIVPLRYQRLQILNPLAQAIQDARYLTITHDSRVVTIWHLAHSYVLFIPFILVIMILVVGLTYFRSQSDSFAENI